MKRKVLLSLLMGGLFVAAEAQWTEQATAFQAPSRGIRYICAVDTNVVWATGYDGITPSNEIQEFTRTTNGGTKWVARSIAGYTGDGLSMIHAVDSMHAWIPIWFSSGGGCIIHTNDGGVTWTQQLTATFNAPNGFPNVVHFWDQNEGFCMGDPNGGWFEIYTTNDGGTTWTRVPQTDVPANLSGEWGTTGLYDVVGDIVWFTTGKGRVYKSIDRGHHWTVSATPNTTDQMLVSFRNAMYGIVKTNQPPYPAWYTSDGGSTWQTLSSAGNFYNSDFCYIPGTTNTFLSVGSDYTTPFMGVSYSLDGGLIWDDYPGTNTNQYLKVDFVNNRCGWAGAFNTDSITGGIWKYSGYDFVYDPCGAFAALFTQDADTVDLNVSGLVNFTDLSSGTPTAWDWDFGDGGSATTQNPAYTYATTGTFTVTLIASTSSCGDTATGQVVVINSAGIAQNNGALQVEIYPNPASEYLYARSAEDIAQIEIFDARGQRVMHVAVNGNAHHIDVSALPQGLYFIRLYTKDHVTDGKFIVRH